MAKQNGKSWIIGVGTIFHLAVVSMANAAIIGPTTTEHGSSGSFAVFEPKPDGRDEAISYDGLDALLEGIVMRTGPSLREWMPPPPPMTGSHLTYGHTSPVRLEGNRVVFSQLNDEAKWVVNTLTDEIIDVGQRADLTRLPRDEQLAYWFNLHNLLVMRAILQKYPTQSPSRLKFGPDKRPFHEAPMAEIHGVTLSLRDIRLNIVYRYWGDPRVMYGFFHGDLASPNIRAEAWRGANIEQGLDSNAHEFINALRGVRRMRKEMRVSPLYEEARPAFFAGWPEDLRTHLYEFAEAPVARILDTADSVTLSRYEHRTADLVGGQYYLPYAPLVSLKIKSVRGNWRPSTDIPIGSPLFSFAYHQIQRKLEKLRRIRTRRVFVNGRVIITDLPFDESDQTATDQ